MKEYTKIRRFYAWIGFLVVVIFIAFFITIFIELLKQLLLGL